MKEKSIEQLVATDCYQVIARGHGGYEGVMVSDEVIAAKQRKVFADAGYWEISVDLRVVLISTETGKGYVPIPGAPLPGGLTTVHQEVVPARYTRADNNPGISIRRYEREVLERPRATTGQALCVAVTTIVMMAIPIGSLISGAAWGAEAVGYQNGVMVSAIATGAIAGLAIVLRWANACVRAAEWVAGITPSDEYYAK